LAGIAFDTSSHDDDIPKQNETFYRVGEKKRVDEIRPFEMPQRNKRNTLKVLFSVQ
jgi:hypothetical protein